MSDAAPAPTGGDVQTILVVDDEDVVRRTMVRMLQHSGFETLEAKDGSEAIHVLAQHHGRISAITLDIAMPTTDGGETLAMLASYTPSMPIVVATAFALGEFFGARAGTRGIGYLQKPFSREELVTELRRVIEAMRGT